MLLQHRMFCTLTLAIGCISSSLLLDAPPLAAAGQPSIVMVLADDLEWNDLGCYGNADVKTPHLDRLASQGMRFTHSFTATAMCAPTRQQLYTGIFPVRNGAYPNHSRVKDGTRSIVHHLRKLGYRVGLCGKTHFGPRQSFPFELLKASQIEEFIARDKSQPYCLVYTSHSPHQPWKEGDASAYDQASLKIKPYQVDTPAQRKAMASYYAEVTDFDRETGEVMQAVDRVGDPQNTIFIATSEQGPQFPHGKWTCYDTGLRTALIIRWPAKVKPGSTTAAMVQYVDVLPTLLAAASGKPQQNKPQQNKPQQNKPQQNKPRQNRPRQNKPLTKMDGRSFLPVLLGNSQHHNDFVYGVHTTRGIIHGSDCYPVRSVRSKTHKLILNLNHQTLFQNTLTHNTDKGGYWKSWVEKAKTDPAAAKLVNAYQKRPAVELYDVVADPYELNNLAGAADLARVQQQLQQKLTAWMKQQGDQGVATELAVKSHKTVQKK